MECKAIFLRFSYEITIIAITLIIIINDTKRIERFVAKSGHASHSLSTVREYPSSHACHIFPLYPSAHDPV